MICLWWGWLLGRYYLWRYQAGMDRLLAMTPAERFLFLGELGYTLAVDDATVQVYQKGEGPDKVVISFRKKLGGR